MSYVRTESLTGIAKVTKGAGDGGCSIAQKEMTASHIRAGTGC